MHKKWGMVYQKRGAQNIGIKWGLLMTIKLWKAETFMGY